MGLAGFFKHAAPMGLNAAFGAFDIYSAAKAEHQYKSSKLFNVAATAAMTPLYFIPHWGAIPVMIGAGLAKDALVSGIDAATKKGYELNRWRRSPVVMNQYVQSSLQRGIDKLGRAGETYNSFMNNRAFAIHRKFGVGI